MSYTIIKTCPQCGQPTLIEMQGQRLGCTCDCYDAAVARTCAKVIAARDEHLALYRETPSRNVAERMAGVFAKASGDGFRCWAQKSPYSEAWWALISGVETYRRLKSGAIRLAVEGKDIARAVPVSSAGGMRTK